MYKILNNKVCTPTARTKWERVFNFDDYEWEQIYICPFITTKCSKMLWLQYRINHRILATNNFLNKIGLSENFNCSFCERERETLEHLFWECDKIRGLLHTFSQYVQSINVNVEFDKKTFIFGKFANAKYCRIENLILLMIKLYIYNVKCKGNTLSLDGLLKFIQYYFHVHKSAAHLHNTIDKFNEDCHPYLGLIENR